MNKDRRNAINAVLARFGDARAEMELIHDELESLRDEEQEYYDNMPESFQQGDKGDRAQAAIDLLESALSELEASDFDSIENYLVEAVDA